MSKFTALLSSMAMSELRSLHDYFQSSRDALSQSPSSLDQLAEVVNLHKKLYEEKKRTEARFEPLREKFKVRGAILSTNAADGEDYQLPHVYK